jgi:oxygen-dependent protoporphyrinogen oxidase
MEPFARKAPGTDETVYDFASRRIGEEAARILVDAMVSGIFAGNTKNLSVASALPLLTKLEAEHGGLIRGMIAKMREARRARLAGGAVKQVDAGPGGNLTSFRDGMETLPQALAAGIPELTLATAVEAIEQRPGGGYRVRTNRGETIEAPVLVAATPPWVTSGLCRPLDATLADDLAAIPSSPIAVIATGYGADQLPSSLDGFGFLVPRGEGLRLLGCLWDSSIFRFRAPVGKVLLRTMIGGAHDPDVVKLDAKELLAIVRRELAQVLGITAEPEFVRVIQHRRGIPQYPPGHGARLERIDARLAALPGLYLAGYGYRGIAVNRVIEDSVAVSARIAEAMASWAPGRTR